MHLQPEPSASADRAAVFRTLADGRVHTPAELGQVVSADHVTAGRIVDDLKSLGMPLQGVAGRVRSLPFVPLDRSAIERHLADETWQVEVAFETHSTNTDVLRGVRNHGDHRRSRLVTAEVQRAGRGRRGRPWISPPGASLAVSFGFCIGRALGDLDGVTLACGLAVQQALADFGTAARLKWPNDLLVDGRKLAGILVEAHAATGTTLLVVGVGVNVTAAPASGYRTVEHPALEPAHLFPVGEAPLDRNRLAARLGTALDGHVRTFARSGFAPFVARWNEHDAFRGRPVTVGAAIGIARGIDASGALLLEVDGIVQRVIAGDVSLRETMPAGA